MLVARDVILNSSSTLAPRTPPTRRPWPSASLLRDVCCLLSDALPLRGRVGGSELRLLQPCSAGIRLS